MCSLVVLKSQDNRLYFFQFPSPFPKFLPSVGANLDDPDAHETINPPGTVDIPSITSETGGESLGQATTLKRSKSVSFALETKPPMLMADQPPSLMDGLIGHLEIYKSGTVKMRLENGIILDVRLHYLAVCG